MTTKDTIIKNAKKIFAKESLDGLSMRKLAEKSNIALSVIYHYFSSKDELLDELYKSIVKDLNTSAKERIIGRSTKIKVRQYFEFCFENSAELVFCYKYFLAYRHTFKKNPAGYLPSGFTDVIAQILDEGTKAKEIKSKDVMQDAKFISYIIQGAILEHYPQIPSASNLESLVQKLMARLESSIFS